MLKTGPSSILVTEVSHKTIESHKGPTHTDSNILENEY